MAKKINAKKSSSKKLDTKSNNSLSVRNINLSKNKTKFVKSKTTVKVSKPIKNSKSKTVKSKIIKKNKNNSKTTKKNKSYIKVIDSESNSDIDNKNKTEITLGSSVNLPDTEKLTKKDLDEFSHDFEFSINKKQKLLILGTIIGIIVILLIFLFSKISFVGNTSDNNIIDNNDDINVQIYEENVNDIISENSLDDVDENSLIQENVNTLSDANSIENSNNNLNEQTFVLPEDMINFTVQPGCNLGYHLIKIYTQFSKNPRYITIQAKDKNNEYSDLKTIIPDSLGYYYIYICQNCNNINDWPKLSVDTEYNIRLKLDYFNEISYTPEMFVSTMYDSNYMTNICSSKDKYYCDDTEYFKNPNTRGKIVYSGKEYLEQCVDEMHTDEYWCEPGEVKHEVVECKIKCYLGKCID